MSLPSRTKYVDRVFCGNQNLLMRIKNAIGMVRIRQAEGTSTYWFTAETPQNAALFDEIAIYCEIYHDPSHPRLATDDIHPPASKKRKLENEVVQESASAEQKRLLRVNDVSFSIPLRRKLHLELIKRGDHTWIQGRDTKTDQVEFSLNLSGYRKVHQLMWSRKLSFQRVCVSPACSREGPKAIQFLSVARPRF